MTAIPDEDFPIERVESQLEASPQECREGRVGVPERLVALAERPDRAREPVGGVRVGRVGELLGIRARIQRPVRLHPEHEVAQPRVGGERLHVGHASEQPVRRGAAVIVTELPPVAEVHDGGPGQVIGVEGALTVGVRVRVIGAATEPPIRPVCLWLGIGPEDPQAWLVREPVGRVTGLRRRCHHVAEEVEMGEVRQREGGRADGRGPHAGDQQRDRDEHREQRRPGDPAAGIGRSEHHMTPVGCDS